MAIELHAVHDSRGTIVAASLVDPDDESALVAIPQAGDDTYLVRIQLDEAHAKMPLERLCTTTRVDPGRNRLVPQEGAAD